MLGNSIALIAVAALFGLEAWKASGGIARVVLTLLAVVFALSGALLKPLSDAMPRLGQLVADTFSQPAAWFVLLMGLFFVVRPLWANERQPKGNPYRVLWTRADNIVGRVRQQRNDGWRLRLLGGEPVTDVTRDGFSTLLMFKQQGFAIPTFNTNSAEKIAIGLEHYFATMMPLLRDGHIEMARTTAPETSNVAESQAARFQLKDWSNDPYDGF